MTEQLVVRNKWDVALLGRFICHSSAHAHEQQPGLPLKFAICAVSLLQVVIKQIMVGLVHVQHTTCH